MVLFTQSWKEITAIAKAQCERALIQEPLQNCIIFIWQMCRCQLFDISLLQSLFERSKQKMPSFTCKGAVTKYFSIIPSQLTDPGTRTSRNRQRIPSKYGTVCNYSYIHTTHNKNVFVTIEFLDFTTSILFITRTFLGTWLFWYLSRIMLILIKVLFFPDRRALKFLKVKYNPTNKKLLALHYFDFRIKNRFNLVLAPGAIIRRNVVNIHTSMHTYSLPYKAAKKLQVAKTPQSTSNTLQNTVTKTVRDMLQKLLKALRQKRHNIHTQEVACVTIKWTYVNQPFQYLAELSK